MKKTNNLGAETPLSMAKKLSIPKEDAILMDEIIHRVANYFIGTKHLNIFRLVHVITDAELFLDLRLKRQIDMLLELDNKSQTGTPNFNLKAAYISTFGDKFEVIEDDRGDDSYLITLSTFCTIPKLPKQFLVFCMNYLSDMCNRLIVMTQEKDCSLAFSGTSFT